MIKVDKKVENYCWFDSLSIAGICLNIFEGKARSNREILGKNIDGYGRMSHPVIVYTAAAIHQFIGLLDNKKMIKGKKFQDRIAKAAILYRQRELTVEETNLVDELHKLRCADLHLPHHIFPTSQEISENNSDQIYDWPESNHDKKVNNDCKKYFDWVMKFIQDVELGVIKKTNYKVSLRPNLSTSSTII